MITQKTKVKRAFNDRGLQVSGDALDFIDGVLEEFVRDIVRKANELGMKRVKGNGYLADMMRSVIEALAPEKKCDRCGGLRDEFLKFARQLQQFVADEAKVMLVKGGFVE